MTTSTHRTERDDVEAKAQLDARAQSRLRYRLRGALMSALARAETDYISIPPSAVLGVDFRNPPGISAVIAAAYLDHSAAIRGMALRASRDPELAADVTQDAFLRLFVEAQAGRLPDNVRAWLYRTSANLIVSRARHAAVARRLAPRLVRFDGPAEPDAIAVLREQQGELGIALASLSAADRVALLMAANGATGEEIARHLGRSHIATRTLLSRARKRLRTAATTVDARSGEPDRGPLVNRPTAAARGGRRAVPPQSGRMWTAEWGVHVDDLSDPATERASDMRPGCGHQHET